MKVIDSFQNCLNYGNCSGRHYVGNYALGKMGSTGFLIGFTCGFTFSIVLLTVLLIATEALSPTWLQFFFLISHWSLYLFSLSVFHFLEFFVTSVYQPNTLSYESYIVNHSTSYTVAILASVIEFWSEYLFFGYKKNQLWLIIFGGILVTFGQVVRTIAMSTCGENFSHQIMQDKSPSHKLVTHGIYAWFRHPSYLGWFWWCVGTQILLCNPFCTVTYAVVAWCFFKERIDFEERVLLKSYGQEYEMYSKHTYIGIPFI